MADVAGLVLAIPGLVQTCLVAYQTLNSAASISRDGRTLHLLFQIEENRLLVAGKALGLIGLATANDTNDPKEIIRIFRERIPNDASIQLVHRILQGISDILTDLEKLTKRYGLHIELGDSIENTSKDQIHPVLCSTAPLARASRKLSFGRKLRWSIKDRSLFSQLLGELKQMNDGLEEQFTSQQKWTLQALLPAQYTNITTEEQLHDIQSVSGIYPILDQSIKLRSFIITLKKAEGRSMSTRLDPGIFDLAGFIDIERDHYSTAELSSRSAGRYREARQRVLIEWKVVQPHVDFSLSWNSEILLDRVDRLASLLKYASSITSMRVPKCLGFHDDLHLNGRLGLVYGVDEEDTSRIPSPNKHQLLVTSLWSLLGPPKKLPPLGDRFALAITLCGTLLQLHTVGWLHKGLRSHNIAFVPPISPDSENDTSMSTSDKAFKAIDITKPWLLGFEYARPDAPNEMSESVGFGFEDHFLYVHPDLLSRVYAPSEIEKRYCRRFDVYSLGCILLEIGLWKRLSDLWKPKYRGDPEVFRSRLIKLWTPELEGRCGSIYTSAVRDCLEGFLGVGDPSEVTHQEVKNVEELDWFFQKVLFKLQCCKV